MRSRNFAPGQAFLSLVFLIGAIVLMIGVFLAFISSAFIDTGYGFQSSSNAEAAATSGAEDAMLQLVRNANFSSTGYSVSAASSTATVVVTQGSPSSGFITVLSTATVSNRIKKVQVILSLNASTSQASVVSWQEVQ